MTTSANAIRLANLSLLSIGARSQISSFNEGSVEANACSTLFTFVFENLARSAPWNCLRQQAVLTLLAAAEGTPENPDGTTLPLPPTPWLYSYAEPSDNLQIRYIVPSLPSTSLGNSPLTTASVSAATWLPSDGQIPFAVAYGTDSQNNPIQVILTNQTQAQVVYTVNQPNPVIWDSMLTSAFVSAMAAYLVPALSLNLPLMQLSIRAADAIIVQARVRDGDEGFTSQNREASWMQARVSGGYVGWNNAMGMGCNYSAMPWPIG